MANVKPEKLKGIFPALMTAFKRDADQSFDAENTKKLCRFLAETGCNGLYVGGSSGEMILMNVDERKALLEAVMEVAKETGLAIIAHTGATSTRDTLELTRHAESVGADAVSSVTPLYFKYTVREVNHYYERIAGETNLPVIIYNIPGMTGLSLNREQLGDLLSISGVGGMKFTSSDYCQLERLVSDFPDKVFYNGADEMLLSGLAAGADGGIGTTYNFMPEKFVKIYNDFKAGRIDDARKTQGEANEIICAILKHGGMASSKYLINRRGFEYGLCREPFMPVSEESAKALDALKLV